VTDDNPFDIAADLDTPVSAYLKLKPFRPRFLLESVEGGERLARYSFIGFGDCLEVRLDAQGLRVGEQRLPRPRDQAELLDALRRALAAAPRPDDSAVPFPLHGGLVGAASYDLVRYFERLPNRLTPATIRPMRTISRRVRCSCSITSRGAPRCCTQAPRRNARRCDAR
jgi:anthranilate synthase component 1